MAGEIIRPKDLPPKSDINPNARIAADDETRVWGPTIAEAVGQARPFATQPQAEAGTSTTATMNPLTTKQSIASEVGVSLASRAQGDLAGTAVQPGSLAVVATSGAYADLSGRPALGTAAATNASAYATAEQGSKADTAVQTANVGTAAAKDIGFFATAAQGGKADTALQAVIAGTNVTVDSTDPSRPVVSAAGGGGVAPPPKGHIYGLTLSNNVTDATNDINVAPGEAASDDSSPTLMRLSSGITKRLDAAWAVGTGNGGLDTGSIANATYHKWLIQRSDTGIVDSLFSLSATSPLLPPNYDQKRRIGAIIRSGGIILPFSQSGNEWLLKTPVSDLLANNPGTAAVLAPMTVPNGAQVTAIIWGFLRTTENVRRAVVITSPDQNAVTPSAGTMSTFVTGLDGIAGGTTTGEIRVRTNTSRQIRYQMDGSSAATALFLTTIGWIDAI